MMNGISAGITFLKNESDVSVSFENTDPAFFALTISSALSRARQS